MTASQGRRKPVAPGRCIRHGYVIEHCCVLWESVPQTRYLRDALAPFRGFAL